MKPTLAQLDSAYRALEQAGLHQAFETFREYIDGMEGELGELMKDKAMLEDALDKVEALSRGGKGELAIHMLVNAMKEGK